MLNKYFFEFLMNKCLFLDRDGVINKDKVDYVYRLEDLKILPGVPEAIALAKKNDFLVVVITNQSGIDKGLYTAAEVHTIHKAIQEACHGNIDAFYFCPYHRAYTASLARKPGSLMFEKAIAKFGIDTSKSWMVGDRFRDLDPAQKLGIKTVLVESEYDEPFDGNKAKDLLDAVQRYVLA